MPASFPFVDRKKILGGVLLIFAGAVLMLAGRENPPILLQIIYTLLLGVGLFLYLWGRFFSRDKV